MPVAIHWISVTCFQSPNTTVAQLVWLQAQWHLSLSVTSHPKAIAAVVPLDIERSSHASVGANALACSSCLSQAPIPRLFFGEDGHVLPLCLVNFRMEHVVWIKLICGTWNTAPFCEDCRQGEEVFHIHQDSFLLHAIIQWKSIVLNLLYPKVM